MVAKVREYAIPVPGRDAKADMVHVAALAARRRAAHRPELPVDGNEIDQRRSCPKLIQPDLLLLLLPARAEHVDVEARDPLEVGDAEDDMVDRLEVDHCRSSAATPGSVRPSIHSRNAPPAVETKVKSCATPAWFSAATVSPPPATETSDPSLVNAAAMFASATVASSNGGVSNAPSGPFQTNVRQVLRASASASTAAGPTSRIISSAATSWTLQVRRLGGLGANSFATTTS